MSFLAGLGAMGPLGGSALGAVATKPPIDYGKLFGALGGVASSATPKKTAQAAPAAPHDFRNPWINVPLQGPPLAGGQRLTGLEVYGR